MSKTFSNMCNPDLIITIQAYAFMKMKLKERLTSVTSIPLSDPQFKKEAALLQEKIKRVDELSAALIDEFDHREIT